MNFNKILKNKFIIIIAYALISSVLIFNISSTFQSLPSPIYGGDYYYQAGSIEHISSEWEVLESSSMEGGVPGYLPLYGIFVSIIKNLFSLNTFQAMFISATLLMALSILIHFILFKKLTRNKLIASLITVLIVSPQIILKYTSFTKLIMIPLFLIFLLNLYDSKSKLNFALLGLSWGLLSWTNNVAFIGSTIILGVFILFSIKDINKLPLELLKYKINILLFLMTSIPFIFAMWYKPIFIFGLKQTYDRIHMDFPDLHIFKIQLGFLLNTIKNTFFNFTSLNNTIISLLSFIGGVTLIFNKEQKKGRLRFIKIFFIAGLIVIFCYFLTEPLFNLNFSPGHQKTFWLTPFVIPTLIYIGIITLKSLNKHKKIFNTIILTLIILISLINIYDFQQKIKEDRWINSGKSPLPLHLQSVKKFILKESNINDIILSTKENSFALNALTGRKLLVNRWAQQNDPFIDLPRRDIDAAIILYGNNSEHKKELIKKYNLKYVYWDYYWIQSEYYFDETDKITGWFDPLISYQTNSIKRLLKENNLSYFEQYTWVDPSVKREDIRKFDLIFISPGNYHNITHPWHINLDKYLKEVWSYKQDGQKIAKLFEIVI